MKKIILPAIVIALLATSCSKNNDTTPEEELNKTEPTVLLTKITNNTQGDQDFGKTVAEFIYSEKKLIQAAIYSYSNVATYKETHTLSYNTQNQLTGSTISHSNVNSYDYINSTITMNGNNIAKINFNRANNVAGTEHTFTYDGNKLLRWFTPSEVEILFTYNEKGNNTKQVATEYSLGTPTRYVYTDNYYSFDSKHSVTAALPYWIYFRVGNGDSGLGYIPGANNPVTANETGSEYTYVYEYNTNGYPTKITRIGTGTRNQSYIYEYKTVN